MSGSAPVSKGVDEIGPAPVLEIHAD